MAHDLLDLGFVLLDTEFGILLLDVLHGLSQAALALALELPASCEFDAAPAARPLRSFVSVLGDVNVRDRELLALLERARGDELELVRADDKGRTGGRVARVRKLWINEA